MAQNREKISLSLSLSRGISVVLNLITEDFQVTKMKGKVRTAWESGKAAEVFLQTLQKECLYD